MEGGEGKASYCVTGLCGAVKGKDPVSSLSVWYEDE